MEDSKSSSEESGNKQENVNDDAGTGRSYECVFCKRGFNTAQALGGHMNIHRRDRARTKQPICPLISSQPLEDYSRPGGFYQSSAIHSALNSSFRETHRNYQTYFPTSSNEHQYGFHRDEFHFQKIRPLSLFDETWRPSLSLRISPTHIEQRYEEKKEDKEEDGVDLELRLGHDP